MISTAVRGRALASAAVVLIIAAVVAGIIVFTHHGSTSAPYTDAAATGTIALCDRGGHQVTSGSTSDKPFAWRAVGATAAPAAYAGSGRAATLFVYQPRSGVDPTEWSGHQLTAASNYTNAKHPMAAATDGDTDLQDFLSAYPAQDSGFVQLRLYLTATGQPDLTDKYDALDLKVSGSAWHAVGGTGLSCSSGTSTSFETEVGLTPSPTASSSPSS
jgi:hypothetical protein